jgi:hypothetical protein
MESFHRPSFSERDEGRFGFRVQWIKLNIRGIWSFMKSFRLPSTFSRLLYSSTVVYLALPLLIFFSRWLKPWLAVLVCILLVATLVVVIKHVWKEGCDDQDRDISISPLVLFIGLALLLVWMYYSGSGAFSFQMQDYKKHNLIVDTLSTRPWPVMDKGEGGQDVVLVYYLAYYLPAGLVGKFLGVHAADLTMFIWTLLAVFLFFGWVSKINRRITLPMILLMVFFSGMDVIGFWIAQRDVTPLLTFTHLERWSIYFEYSSFTSLMYWVPQHLIPGWLVTAALVDTYFSGKRLASMVFMSSLVIFWSPFVLLGLIPFLVLIMLTHRKNLRSVFSWINILPSFVVVALVAAYILINPSSDNTSGWIWTLTPNWIHDLILFCLIEFLVLASLLLVLLRGSDRSVKKLLWFTTILLALIPFYKVGVYDDFCMRVSIPGIVVLFLLTIRALDGIRFKHQTFPGKLVILLVVAILVVGSVTPVMEIGRSVTNTDFGGKPRIEVLQKGSLYDTFWRLIRKQEKKETITEQYLFKGELPDYAHMLFDF